MIEILAEGEAPPRVVPGRLHHVTAVLVAHDGQRWLPRTLASLARLHRPPDRMVAVDTGSSDGTGELLAGSRQFGRIVTAERNAGLGAAVQAGLDAADELRPPDRIDLRDRSTDEPIEWIWLLQDDCATTPGSLGALLRTADEHPAAAVVGPKVRSWGRADLLLERGLSVTSGGRIETGVARGEVDQGQHDGTSEVFAVGAAGMLVRRDLWDRLGGFSPALPLYRADLEFCWRARRAGHAVVVASDAVVRNRRASHSDLRSVDSAPGPRRVAERRAATFTALVHTQTWLLPFRALRVAIGTLLRFVLDLVTLSPGRGWASLRGSFAALGSVRQLARARADVRRVATVPPRELARFRPTATQRLTHWQESVADYGADGTPGTTFGQRLADGLSALALIGVPLLLVSLLANPDLWFGSGQVSGGALLPAPDSAADLVSTWLAPWHEVGLGSPVGMPPYVAVLAAAALPVLGSATAAVQWLLLAAPVLAGVSAWFALRGFVARPAGIVAAIGYGLLPATVTAVGTGRLGTAVAAAALPMALRTGLRLLDRPPLPYRGLGGIAAAALWFSVIGAFAPILLPAVVGAAAALAIFAMSLRAFARLLMAFAVSVALLWPWSGTLLGSPRLALLEIGAHPAELGSNPVTPASLAVLDPGGTAAPIAGLAALLSVLAVLALLVRGSRSRVLGAWVFIVAGLMVGVTQLLVEVPVPWSAEELWAWPGPATLLIGAGAIAAAALAWPGSRTAAVGLALGLAAPILLAGWWIGSQNGLVERDSVGATSAYVNAQTTGPGAPRAVALSARDDVLRYQVLSGGGPRLGDADVAPGLASMAVLDRAVSMLVIQGSPQALQELGAASVRFLSVDVRADRDLARRLDAVQGLRRVSTVAGRAVWSLAAWQPRVRAELANGEVTPLPVTGTDPLGVSVALDEPVAAIVLAESANALWRATLDGVELPASTSDPAMFQAFTAGGSGDLEVTASGQERLQQLLVPLVAAGLLVMLTAAGFRRRQVTA